MSKFELSIIACVAMALSACGNAAPVETVTSPAAQTPEPSSVAPAAGAAAAGASAAKPPVTASASPAGASAGTPATATTPAAASGGGGAAATTPSAAGVGATVTAGTGAIAGAAPVVTAGNSAAAGSSGAAGGAAAPTPTYPDCKSEEVGPCGTFVTQGGKKIPLGSYGALMDKNMGKGSEVKVASGDSDGGAQCASVVASFGEDAEESKPLQDVTGIDFALFTVYRPAKWAEGEKFPVISWGNGTCAKPEGYGALLRYVASHGFVVIAANSRWVGGGNSAMIKALDFAEAANADAMSPYYQHLDLEKIGAMGHSQGGMATVTAASDKRIKTVIIWNGGSSAVKTFLAVTGDKDIGSPTVASSKRAVDANGPGAWLFYHKTVGTGSVPGHLTLMKEPERVIEPTVAWFKYQLLNDAPSKDWFLGADCKLCKTPADYEFGQNGLQ
jgi:hypothetical protein